MANLCICKRSVRVPVYEEMSGALSQQGPDIGGLWTNELYCKFGSQVMYDSRTQQNYEIVHIQFLNGDYEFIEGYIRNDNSHIVKDAADYNFGTESVSNQGTSISYKVFHVRGGLPVYNINRVYTGTVYCNANGGKFLALHSVVNPDYPYLWQISYFYEYDSTLGRAVLRPASGNWANPTGYIDTHIQYVSDATVSNLVFNI